MTGCLSIAGYYRGNNQENAMHGIFCWLTAEFSITCGRYVGEKHLELGNYFYIFIGS